MKSGNENRRSVRQQAPVQDNLNKPSNTGRTGFQNGRRCRMAPGMRKQDDKNVEPCGLEFVQLDGRRRREMRDRGTQCLATLDRTTGWTFRRTLFGMATSVIRLSLCGAFHCGETAVIRRE
jgi:hypothetical protein